MDLNNSAPPVIPRLEELGLSKESQNNNMQILRTAKGLVPVCGVSGSWKTTLLYAGLKKLVEEGKKIVTIEEYEEYALPGATQLRVGAEIYEDKQEDLLKKNDGHAPRHHRYRRDKKEEVIRMKPANMIWFFLLLAVVIFTFAGCSKCVSVSYESVEVTVVDTYYRPMWIQPIYTGKTMVNITHPAVWHTSVQYDGVEYTVGGSSAYETCKDKIGQTVQGELQIKTYDDGTVRYEIVSLG